MKEVSEIEGYGVKVKHHPLLIGDIMTHNFEK
jgi:hypothetical protein